MFRQHDLPDRFNHPEFLGIFLDLYKSAGYNSGCQERLHMIEARLGRPHRSSDFTGIMVHQSRHWNPSCCV